MSSIDPGLAIVATVLVVVAGFGVGALLRRRATRARMVALRTARRIEVPVVSPARAAGIACAFAAPIVFGAPFVAMALGSWGRAHALELTLVVIVLAMLAVIAPITYAARWTRVGRVVLEGDALRVETRAATASIALDRAFDLREGTVPPGQRIETVVAVTGGRRVDHVPLSSAVRRRLARTAGLDLGADRRVGRRRGPHRPRAAQGALVAIGPAPRSSVESRPSASASR